MLVFLYKSTKIVVPDGFYEMYELTQVYCVSTHNSYWSLENCNFHILLIGSSFDKILPRLNNFHFTYQIFDCLHTLYKYSFFLNVLLSTAEVFNQLDRAVHHKLKWKGAEKNSMCCKEKTVTQKIQTSRFYVLTRT